MVTTNHTPKKEEIMQKAYSELRNLSDFEFKEKALVIKQKMAMHQSGKILKTEEEVPITELFYLYEGVLNNEFGNIYAEVENLQSASSTFEVDIHADSMDNYYVWASDVGQLYVELANEIETEVDTNNQEVMLMADLELQEVNIPQNKATIRMTVYAGVANLWYTPDGAVYGAELEGWCHNSQGNFDGATFLQAYANAHAPHKLNNPCTGGTQPYTVGGVGYITYDIYSHFDPSKQNLTYWNNNVLPNLWHDDVNSCMGGNEVEDWTYWYDKMDNLMNLELSYVQANFHPNANFVFTNFHSKNDGNFNPMPQGDQFYHTGHFIYSLIICQ